MMLWSRFVHIETEISALSNQILQFKENSPNKIISLISKQQCLQFEEKR